MSNVLNLGNFASHAAQTIGDRSVVLAVRLVKDDGALVAECAMGANGNDAEVLHSLAEAIAYLEGAVEKVMEMAVSLEHAKGRVRLSKDKIREKLTEAFDKVLAEAMAHNVVDDSTLTVRDHKPRRG